MLSFEDCLALSALSEDEVAAIAEHEHCPDMIAAELGCYLIHTDFGTKRIKAIIQEDIEAARARGDVAHSARLKLLLQHFIKDHAGATPW
jgi:hypothetical protein